MNVIFSTNFEMVLYIRGNYEHDLGVYKHFISQVGHDWVITTTIRSYL